MWADGRKSGLALTLLIAAQAGVAVVNAQEAADTGVTIAERLERIESALSNQGLLEMVQQIQSLEVEINRLSGEMEVQNHVLEQLKKRQRDLYTDIDRRLQRLENPLTAATGELAGEGEPPLQTLSPFEGTEVTAGQQAETPLTLELVDQVGQEPPPGSAEEDIVPLTAPPDQAAEQVPEPAPPASAPAQQAALPETPDQIGAETPGQDLAASGTPGEVVAEAPAAVDPVLIEAAYRHAFNLLKQSLYDPAIKAFREFLMRYPGTEYAGNAQFWLAEAYYVNSRFGQALVEYGTLVQRYPESPKLAQATLKAAFCQHELGQVEAARRQLDEIIQQYPGTTAASLAQDRLADIAAETAAVTTTPAN
ncbi:MAG: tol-pal system protein YbgF [Gammaproteobacteria bacterium]|nr:tol-pal system protein YbgF [Gammaproteobacteria bacterium]MDE0285305.1 tol-pal system protein YbgF [Gammaproteobacteria bacterium]MDE0513437.1 tol-pal system protein YbgF [Gammaproteobacteria bacterium]